MKNILNYIIAGVLIITVSSCEDFLDINDNPNTPTAATANIVLPNALTSTGATLASFSHNAGWLTGYLVNAGGYGGWGDVVYYNYSISSHTGPWTLAYDDLVNYQYIIDKTSDVPADVNYTAVAMIMKAFDFHMLVDVYGDIPYTQALGGVNNLTPVYDSQSAVYQSLVESLTEAISLIQNAENANSLETVDVVFDGDMDSWVKFANTLKLRLLIRMSGVSSLKSFVDAQFADADFAAAGFLTDDVFLNPGFGNVQNQQNPYWSTFVADASGTASGSGRSRITSYYTFGFYDGTKISDEWRGRATYRSYPSTPIGQLGNLTDNPNAPASPNPVWLSSTTPQIGLLKGASAGVPLMLAAESYFLQAEAYMKGFLVGSDEDAFNDGIEASFTFLYKDATGSVAKSPTADIAAYLAENADNYLVDYAAASTDDEKLEAIITQKYIALNFLQGQEAWSEFRRTGYPKVAVNSTNEDATFASILSTSSRPDRLPVRFLYPDTEFQLNTNNVPSGISQFNSLIFFQAD